MDLFKTVFSDDAGSESSEPSADPTPSGGSSSTWSFGSLVKTLANKSETVIGSYRKDFEEFGSGLRKETDIIRHVASRAVSDSLEIGASVAQVKLESVGQAIDDIGSSVWKSTAEIISQGKDALLSPSDDDNSDSENSYSNRLNSVNEKRYSRIEMQIRALQLDINTYYKEPEDLGDFENWKLGFSLEEKKGEIEDLFNENSVIRDIFKDISSDELEWKRYWNNYFYKLSKLMKAEEARAKLVRSALSGEEEEDLRWDIEDDEEGEKKNNFSEDGEKWSKNDEETAGSSKDSDVSVVSSHVSMPEDEGWDEIEEIMDESKGDDVGSTSRVDLRKRLTVADEEEDLSWDIEDDDDDAVQPVKA